MSKKEYAETALNERAQFFDYVSTLIPIRSARNTLTLQLIYTIGQWVTRALPQASHLVNVLLRVAGTSIGPFAANTAYATFNMLNDHK